MCDNSADVQCDSTPVAAQNSNCGSEKASLDTGDINGDDVTVMVQ